MSSNEWKTMIINDVCSKITSGGTPNTGKSEYYNGDIPWLKTQEVNFKRIRKTDTTITEDGLANSSAKWIPENSIIVAMYGATAGKIAINKIPLTTNQACCNLIVNNKIADYNFIYYNLFSRYNEISSMAVGGAQQNLNAGMIKDLEIQIPPLDIQKKIGFTLSSIDDKIELLYEINSNLEQLINALFQEFCVLTTDKPSDKWQTATLKEFIEVKNGFAFKGGDFIDEGIPVLKIKNVKAGKVILNNLSYVSREIADKAQRFRIKQNDLLITMSGNRIDGTPETWVGKVGIFHRNGEYLLNQRVSILNILDEERISRYFLCQLLSSEDFQYYFISNATSSGGQANISPDLIYNTEIVVPPKEIMQKFHQQAEGIYSKIFANELEIETLSNLRDTLLPKLMKGEIKV
jgi:type I restriction enzyme S subunit